MAVCSRWEECKESKEWGALDSRSAPTGRSRGTSSWLNGKASTDRAPGEFLWKFLLGRRGWRWGASQSLRIHTFGGSSQPRVEYIADAAEQVEDALEATSDVDISSPGPEIKVGKVLSKFGKAELCFQTDFCRNSFHPQVLTGFPYRPPLLPSVPSSALNSLEREREREITFPEVSRLVGVLNSKNRLGKRESSFATADNEDCNSLQCLILAL